jgi:hypothetical protein
MTNPKRNIFPLRLVTQAGDGRQNIPPSAPASPAPTYLQYPPITH